MKFLKKEILIPVLFSLTPFFLYFLLKIGGTRPALILIALLIGRRFLSSFIKQNREITFMFSIQVIILISLFILGYIVNNPLIIKAIPAIFSGFLCITFSATLFKGQSMIERFARMKEKELDETQIIYCRKITVIWVLFFLLNAIFIAIIGFFGSLEWWMIASGPLSYSMIALLFLIEYSYRTIIFKKYNPNFFYDRFLQFIVTRKNN